jgi:hypothetical protein
MEKNFDTDFILVHWFWLDFHLFFEAFGSFMNYVNFKNIQRSLADPGKLSWIQGVNPPGKTSSS